MITYKIRKAKLRDIKTIHELINYYAKRDLLLNRSLMELYDHIRDFFICEYKSKIIAICSLNICWQDLAEIRSLAVKKGFQNKGVGTELIKECIKEAKELGIKRVFTLTPSPKFFIKQGFKKTKKELLPQQIWAFCVQCVKFPNCDETALIYDRL
ncbi:MAG: N-acetyltransferase [Candidatus Firestonebacteria bacterium]